MARHLPLMSFLLPISCALLLALPLASLAQEDKLSEATKLELDYVRSLADDLRTKAREPLKELEDKYLAAVGKIRDEAEAKVKVADRLEAEATLAEFKKSGTPDGESGHMGIARMEKIYLEQRPKVEAQIRPALVKAEQAYGKELKRMTEGLTKEGQIEQALVLKKELDGLASRLRTLQQGGGPVAVKTRAVPKVTILKATFACGDRSADVTRKIAEFVANGKDFSANPKDLGVDPKPYHRKRLHISYEKDGIKREQNRGENETVLVESFTGPQDAKEVVAWLTGTTWKSETCDLFFKDKSDVKNKAVTGKWRPDGMYWISIEWSAGDRRRYKFNWRWTEFQEAGGMEEKFAPVN